MLCRLAEKVTEARALQNAKAAGDAEQQALAAALAAAKADEKKAKEDAAHERALYLGTLGRADALKAENKELGDTAAAAADAAGAFKAAKAKGDGELEALAAALAAARAAEQAALGDAVKAKAEREKALGRADALGALACLREGGGCAAVEKACAADKVRPLARGGLEPRPGPEPDP